MSVTFPYTLAGQYELFQLLGGGTFADTYAATNHRTGNTVAVKLLREPYGADPEVVGRFIREAEIAAAIQHPNVVRVWDHGREGDRLYAAMELVDGGTLRHRLRGGGVGVAEALRIIDGVLAGLEAVHRFGVVHRDIKPANILLTRDGVPKLADFGIARAVSESGLTTTGITLGTAAYMAPEQATGDEVGPAADLYAVGAVLYELLTGFPPFPGDDPLTVMFRAVHEAPLPPRSMNPDLPISLSAAVMRALAKDPARRFAGAAEMRAELAAAAVDAVPPAIPAPPRPAGGSLRQVRPRPLALVPALLVLVLALVVVAVFAGSHGTPSVAADAATLTAAQPDTATVLQPTVTVVPSLSPTVAAVSSTAPAETPVPIATATETPAVATEQPVVHANVPAPAPETTGVPATHNDVKAPAPDPKSPAGGKSAPDQAKKGNDGGPSGKKDKGNTAKHH